MKKVSLRELVADKLLFAILVAIYCLRTQRIEEGAVQITAEP